MASAALILLLKNPRDDNRHQFVGVSLKGEIVIEPAECSLTEASRIAQGLPVVLLITGGEAVVTQVALPQVSLSKALSMLPFALEEQLTNPPEAYHVCLLSRTISAKTPVVYIDKTCLKQWIGECHQAGLLLSAVIPASLLIPQGSIVLYEDRALVGLNDSQGLTSVIDYLPVMLKAALKDASSPSQWMLHDYRDNAALPVVLGYPFSETKHSPQTLVSFLAPHLIGAMDYNLLRGEFLQKAPRNKMRILWIVGMAIAATAFIVQAASLLIERHVLMATHPMIETQIALIYKKHFPASTAIVAPELRFQEKLRQAEQGGGDKEFLVLLTKTGDVLRTAGPVTINKIDYKKNTLHMTLLLENIDQLQKLEKSLALASMPVTQESVLSEGAGIKVIVRIKGEKP